MSSAKKLVLALGDIAILYGSLALTMLLRYPQTRFPEHFGNHLVPFSLIFVVWLLVFYLADLYRQKTFRGEQVLEKTFASALLVAGLASVILFYLFGDFFRLTPKTNLALFILFFGLIDFTWRRIFLSLALRGQTPLIIIGSSPRIEETVLYVSKNPHAGYRVAEWIKDTNPEVLADLPGRIKHAEASLIVVEPRLTNNPSVVRTLYYLLPLETSLLSFLDFYELVFEKVPLNELDEGWFVEHISTRRTFYDVTKRIVDFGLSLVLAAIFVIPGILIAILIRLSSKGPAVFAQERTGKHGVPFTLYKFRSMHDGTHGPLWTKPGDERLTAIGTFLRFTHLDEIPQLWNILRGDISFTGPRPERTELAKQYSEIPYYEIRQIVKPGLTGWAQINYKPSASLEEARAKLEYDIFYAKNRSFFLDLAIIVRTVRYVFTSHE